jgi:hypothetical protein
MKSLKVLFAFYINSSVHVALVVTALVGLTQLSAGLEISWMMYAFVFLGTITGYNFVKYAKVAGLHHRSLAKSLKAIQVFSALCAVLLVVVLWQSPLQILIYAAGFGLLTFLYAVPFMAGYNLRSVGGLKIFIVATVWAGITVIIPVVWAEEAIDATIWLLFLQRLVLVVVWILPFEIRDMRYDSFSLGTMPQRLGVNRTKAVGVVLLGVALLCEFYLSKGALWKISAAGIMIVLSGVMLIRANKRQGQYYASFWVESVPIWWLMVAYFFLQLSL